MTILHNCFSLYVIFHSYFTAGIIGARTSGVIVKTILPGGVADRDGRLQSGDHILQIGNVNLHRMQSEHVAAVLRQSGTHVRLVVARPIDPVERHSSAPVVPTRWVVYYTYIYSI